MLLSLAFFDAERTQTYLKDVVCPKTQNNVVVFRILDFEISSIFNVSDKGV